ncbi:MAG: hypothetical protein K2R98_01205 [Gemmataceae bacterium]|nr:hypothetical protein [Gemmataceae bacterium]
MYVALAGLAWGTYVPIIFFGGSEFGGKPNARLMAILCVGGAYFVIGVVVPLVLFLTGQYEWPTMKSTGLVFSSLAGVAGAVGAICVIFATQAAMKAATDASLPKETYKVFIAPLIFGLAPIINVLVSTVWHPTAEDAFNRGFKMPHPLLWVGILLVGVGAALVLYSKELSEVSHAPAKPAPTVTAEAPSAPEARP